MGDELIISWYDVFFKPIGRNSRLLSTNIYIYIDKWHHTADLAGFIF